MHLSIYIFIVLEMS